MLATVICDARQACSLPCDCISAVFCASAAFNRLSCWTSLLVLSLPSNCCESSELFAVALVLRSLRYWPTAVRQSGETASEVSIKASCDVRELPRDWLARYVGALPLI